MDKPQKYLLFGLAGALAVIFLVASFNTYGDSATFWMLTLGSIVAVMMVLVFDIFLSTKKLVPAKVKSTNAVKKQ